MDKSIANSQRVLEAAARVRGNRKRFLEAGLLDTSSSQVELSPNWQNAFLKLRPIDKQTVRKNPGLFLASVSDVVYRGTTSGSRGQHFIYFAGREWNEARIRARRQSLAWWGIDEKTPIINVASRLFPVREIDMAIAGKPDKDFIHLLLARLVERQSAIRGYPSRLCEVATNFPRQNAPPVIAVICTGECLFEYQRQLLEKVFHAPVIEEYGCQETGISGLTCPEAGRLHLDADRCLYEIIDGQLVTTDLLNYVMPVVRYKCGDIIDFNTDPCPCGRPGPTGKIFGRVEDCVRTADGIKHPGEIIMPPMEGILNYHVVRRQGRRLDIWLCPADADIGNELSLEPLSEWINATFGKVSAQIFLDETDRAQAQQSSCDDALWISSITRGRWADWLKDPALPSGEVRKASELLLKLIDARSIVNSGLPPTTRALLYEILDSPPCKDPEVELLTSRVLLFSCSFLSKDSALLDSIYTQAARRLRSASAQLGRMDDAAKIDLLVPTLFLNINAAKSIWVDCSEPVQCAPDTFNVHNLLYALESAARKARASRQTNVIQALKPIESLLIGDLNFFAPRFGTWLLAHWCELIHGQSVTAPHTAEAPNNDKFLTAWLAWRRHLLKAGNSYSPAQLANLSALAASPEERARVYIEKGYGLLVAGQELDPDEWLDILDKNAGRINSGLPSNDVDPIPWIPILRLLATPLHRRGQEELAYQCLVASAPPSSVTSAFERLAFQVNDKQSVICDFFNGSDNKPDNSTARRR